MRLIDKYIIKQYLVTFSILLCSIFVLFLVIDIFDRLPKLLRYSNDFWLITKYFLYRLPYLIVLVAPFIVLLAGLFLMSNLSKYNESIAIRAAGISIFRMVLPLFFIGIIFSGFIGYIGEYILPLAEKKRAQIYRIEMQKQEIEDIKLRANIFYFDEQFIFFISFFDGYLNKLRVIDITETDRESHIIRKIQANEANWDGEYWVFSDLHDRNFAANNLVSYQFSDTKIIPEISITPLDFVKSAKKPLEMNYFELKEYISRLQKIGEKHHEELIELYLKIVYPFTNFVIMLFCVPLASASVRSKGRGIIFGIGLGICFTYLFIIKLCQSLGINEVLSPLTAVVFPHIVFFLLGIFFVIKAEI